MEYSIENRDTHLQIVVSGATRTQEEWLQYARAIKKALIEFDKRHLLIDRTAASIDLDQSEVIAFVEHIEKSELTKTMRVATLVSAAQLPTCRRLETPFVNRSMSLKFFADRDTALRWLLDGGF